MLILTLGRFVNLAVPFLLADLVSVFEEGVNIIPWAYLLGYVSLRFLQSSGGLPALRDVSRTFLHFSLPRCVHLDPFHLGSLDPRDAVLGSWCAMWKLNVKHPLNLLSRNVSAVIQSPPSSFFRLAYSSQNW